jgi:hypothetical protein
MLQLGAFANERQLQRFIVENAANLFGVLASTMPTGTFRSGDDRRMLPSIRRRNPLQY